MPKKDEAPNRALRWIVGGVAVVASVAAARVVFRQVKREIAIGDRLLRLHEMSAAELDNAEGRRLAKQVERDEKTARPWWMFSRRSEG